MHFHFCAALLFWTSRVTTQEFIATRNFPLVSRGLVLSFSRDIVHRHEANYVQVVHVDYLDYDYDDYFRFWCVEKQLAN